MSRILLVAGTPELADRVRAGHPDLEVLAPGRLPTEPLRLFEQLRGGDLPQVIVVGPAAPLAEVLALASGLDAGWPEISLVLADTPTPELWPAVMRAGIRDVIPRTPTSRCSATCWSGRGRRRSVAGRPDRSRTTPRPMAG